MARYDYECTKCEYQQEEVHGMMDEPMINCEVCGGMCHKVILVAPGGVVLGRTLGAVADKNRAAMSDDAARALQDRFKTKKEDGCGLPSGLERRPQAPERPKQWYDKYTTKTVKQVAKMTTKQTEEYVKSGTTNN